MAHNGYETSQSPSNQALLLQKKKKKKEDVSVIPISFVEFPSVEKTKWNPKAPKYHSAMELANIYIPEEENTRQYLYTQIV